MKVCHYAIVRFRPFSETGEFANIGVVAFEPTSGAIQYKLAPRRYRRVTQFFGIDPKLFNAVIGFFDEELRRASELSELRSSETNAALFGSLIRGRETVVLCSEVRTAALEGSLANFVDELFDRYVRRNFVTQEHRESIMVREIRERLRRARVKGFKPQQIDDELVPVTFQLASKRRDDLFVIKPFAFDQKTTLAIIDHAATWRDRFTQLFDRKRLDPRNVLVTVEPPPLESPHSIFEAYDVARKQLATLPTQLVDYDEQKALYEFASRGSHTDRMLVN